MTSSGDFGSVIPLGSETLKAEDFRAGAIVSDGASTLTGAVAMGSTLG